jgi:hypothetical protein
MTVVLLLRGSYLLLVVVLARKRVSWPKAVSPCCLPDNTVVEEAAGSRCIQTEGDSCSWAEEDCADRQYGIRVCSSFVCSGQDGMRAVPIVAALLILRLLRRTVASRVVARIL